MYISMFKDFCVLRVPLISASLIVVDRHPGVGIHGLGKMFPFPLWLFCPHSIGLLDLVQDVLADHMLLEIW